MNVNPFSYLIEKIKNKVDKNEVYIDSSVDLNNCTDTYTLYYGTGASVPINAPTAGAYNFLVWNETHGNYSCQFYFSYNANKIFWRKREVNSWGSWNELARTSDIKWNELTTITGEYDTEHTYSISKTQYSEILVEYGSKNGSQVFFGGSVNLVTSEDRPSAPCWTYGGQVYTAYIYYSNSTQILTVKNMDYSNDMLFRIYAR